MRAVENRDDRVNRADVGVLALAPAHHLRPAQPFDDPRDGLGEEIAGQASGDGLADPDVRVILVDEVFDLRVALLEKSLECRRRCAVFVRGLFRRTLDLLSLVFALEGKVAQDESDSPRRVVDGDVLAQLFEPRFQLRMREHPRRDLFGQELEKVLRHWSSEEGSRARAWPRGIAVRNGWPGRGRA